MAREKHDQAEEFDDEVEVYEVSKVFNHRVKGGGMQYRVAWVGYEKSANTWEPADIIETDAPDSVNRYWATQPTDLRTANSSFSSGKSVHPPAAKRGRGTGPRKDSNATAASKPAGRRASKAVEVIEVADDDNDEDYREEDEELEEEEEERVLHREASATPPRKGKRRGRKSTRSASKKVSASQVVRSDSEADEASSSSQVRARPRKSTAARASASKANAFASGSGFKRHKKAQDDDDSDLEDVRSTKKRRRVQVAAPDPDSDASSALEVVDAPPSARKKGKAKEKQEDAEEESDSYSDKHLSAKNASVEPRTSSSRAVRALSAKSAGKATTNAGQSGSKSIAPPSGARARVATTSKSAVDKDTGEISNEIKYWNVESWEDLVEDVSELASVNEGTIASVSWTDGSKSSWIPMDVAKAKFPQKLIEFYESITTFVAN